MTNKPQLSRREPKAGRPGVPKLPPDAPPTPPALGGNSLESLPLEQQVQVLRQALSGDMCAYLIMVHRGSGLTLRSIIGNWGEGASGLHLVVRALQAALEQEQRQANIAEVAEMFAARQTEAPSTKPE